MSATDIATDSFCPPGSIKMFDLTENERLHAASSRPRGLSALGEDRDRYGSLFVLLFLWKLKIKHLIQSDDW